MHHYFLIYLVSVFTNSLSQVVHEAEDPFFRMMTKGEEEKVERLTFSLKRSRVTF